MKKILQALLFILIPAAAFAQQGKQSAFGISIDEPFNTGVHDYTTPGILYQDGLGASLTFEAPITSRLHLKLSAGYMYYHSNVDKFFIFPDNDAPTVVDPYAFNSYNYKLFPVKAGLKYYFWKNLYIDGSAGASIKNNAATSTSFIYSGGAGIAIPTGNVGSFDINLDYGTAFKINGLNYYINELGLHVAYRFRL